MESAKLLQAIIETAIDGIITIDDRGRIESLNPSALKIFGYKEEELIGKNISVLMPEPDKSRHDDYLIHYQTTGEKKIIGKGREVRGLRKDGTQFPFRLAVSEVQYQDRMIYTGFIHDLSKEKEAEESLKRYAGELEELVENRTKSLKKMLHELEVAKEEANTSLEKEKDLNKMKSRFVSMASHEFRTPLSSMQLSAVLIEKYLQASDNIQILKHLHKIKNAIASLNSILNDFLSLEKLDTGIVKPHYDLFDIVKFSEELTEEMQLITKEDQIIIYQHAGSESEINLDQNLLRNCLMNLMSNAIKYSGEHTLIEFSTEINEDRYVFSVKDNGIGIPEGDQSGLFQPFFRAHNIGNIPGTGLGLNIVQRYVNLMDGLVHFESTSDKGTEFTLSFHKNSANNTPI
ncbi:PAS domain-containing sensor histidine kinase [Chryseobacterium sp. ES2]|uniref:Sensor protein FixL n=2 Tax=Chryseobacterium TaxID=59732 RepID=A0A5B2U8F9_9FLAO|nr:MULTISPECIES: PAS domain-containing sensor histidine kinase [Chryseobacterium]KAA2222914.1 PAS domain S-box protein [Chryseobacterium sediminis]MDR4951264.1 PAS domain-containing sensor histidine kinase [Chryseobacterium sp. ES2]